MSNEIDTISTNSQPILTSSPSLQSPDSQKLDTLISNLITYVYQEKDLNTGGGQNNAPVLETPNMQMDAESLTLILIQLRAKLGEEQAVTSREEIESNLVTKELQHQEVIQKIEDYLDAMREVNKSNGTMRILGWTAAVVTLVAAVALTVATGGAAAPLLVVAAFMITQMALQEAGEGNVFAEGLADMYMAMGMNEEDAQMAGAITYAVAMLVASIAAAVATGGAGAFALVNATAAIISGSLQIAQGGMAIKKGYDQKDAMEAQADQLDIKALMKRLQAMMDAEMERLEEIITAMDDGIMAVMQMLGGVNDKTDTIMQNIGMTKQMI